MLEVEQHFQDWLEEEPWLQLDSSEAELAGFYPLDQLEQVLQQ